MFGLSSSASGALRIAKESLQEIANAQVIDPELFTKGSLYCHTPAVLGDVGDLGFFTPL